jgi:hypothetical protein
MATQRRRDAADAKVPTAAGSKTPYDIYLETIFNPQLRAARQNSDIVKDISRVQSQLGQAQDSKMAAALCSRIQTLYETETRGLNPTLEESAMDILSAEAKRTAALLTADNEKKAQDVLLRDTLISALQNAISNYKTQHPKAKDAPEIDAKKYDECKTAEQAFELINATFATLYSGAAKFGVVIRKGQHHPLLGLFDTELGKYKDLVDRRPSGKFSAPHFGLQSLFWDEFIKEKLAKRLKDHDAKSTVLMERALVTAREDNVAFEAKSAAFHKLVTDLNTELRKIVTERAEADVSTSRNLAKFISDKSDLSKGAVVVERLLNFTTPGISKVCGEFLDASIREQKDADFHGPLGRLTKMNAESMKLMQDREALVAAIKTFANDGTVPPSDYFALLTQRAAKLSDQKDLEGWKATSIAQSQLVERAFRDNPKIAAILDAGQTLETLISTAQEHINGIKSREGIDLALSSYAASKEKKAFFDKPGKLTPGMQLQNALNTLIDVLPDILSRALSKNESMAERRKHLEETCMSLQIGDKTIKQLLQKEGIYDHVMTALKKQTASVSKPAA